MKRQNYLKITTQSKQKLALSRYKSKLFAQPFNSFQPSEKENYDPSELLSKQEHSKFRTSSLSSAYQNQGPLNYQNVSRKVILPSIRNSIGFDSLKETTSTFKLCKSKSTFHKQRSTKGSFGVEEGQQQHNRPQATFSDLMHQIYAKLNEIFTINQELGITPLRKPAFSKVLGALVQFLENNLKYEMDGRLNQILLTSLYQKEFKLAKIAVFQNKKSKLNLKTKEVEVNVIINQQEQKRNQHQRQMLQMSKEKLKLASQIQEMTAEFTKTVEQKMKKQHELKDFEERVQKLRLLHQVQEVKHNEMKKSIQESTQQLQKAQNQYQRLCNFVSQQKQKMMLHQISSQYKQIQKEIYEYACYLQKNVLTKPIKTGQRLYRNKLKQMDAQLRKLMQSVLNSLNCTQETKKTRSNYFRSLTEDFLAQVESKVKDAENKSQSCKKFIRMIYKWIDIWNLKQKYLISLRKEFLIDTKSFYQLLDSIQQAISLSQSQKHKGLVVQLKKCFEKIEMNYKYGNSFY